MSTLFVKTHNGKKIKLACSFEVKYYDKSHKIVMLELDGTIGGG